MIMKKLTRLKLALPFGLAALATMLLILPVWAGIGGSTDVTFISTGGGSPDIEVGNGGTFIAVTYFKQQTGAGSIYLKSATAASGWLTAKLVGTGSNPKLAFSASASDVVYVVWVNSGGTAIQSARCTLSPTNLPTCTAGANVQTAAANQLGFPDIAVGSDGFVHVAWENNGTIQTARSTAANSVAAWSAPVSVEISANFDRLPTLAWSSGNSGRLHLAFLRGATSDTPTSIQYRRSDDGSPHNWSGTGFAIGSQIIGGSVHDEVDNPAIAAVGNNVFLAWDVHRIGTNDFSLVYKTSGDNGNSWPGAVLYAPSGLDATSTNPSSEIKASSSTGIPVQETGLRPSLAISGTGSVMVWQEIPGGDCTAFQPSVIEYAIPVITAGGDPSGQLANPGSNYEIDPDVAVFGTTGHVVFMKDTTSGSSCGGSVNNYVIAYQGPFTVTDLDQGEEGGRVYLPLVRRN
jgi:hypothetical protein